MGSDADGRAVDKTRLASGRWRQGIVRLVQHEAGLRREIHARRAEDVDEPCHAFADILRDLRTQYLLGYYPTRVPVGDGSYHTVRVEIPQRTELRISTRTGYYGESSR